MRVNKSKDSVVIVVSLSELDRDELKLFMNRGWLSVHEVKEELKRRGENEWKVLVELRAAC